MHDFAYLAIPLFAGLILDALLGDPVWLPHPIRWFGKAISMLEYKFNTEPYQKAKGIGVTLCLVLITGGVFWSVFFIIRQYTVLYFPIASIFVFFGIANRSLINEAIKVNRTLRYKGLDAGRTQLSWIVGRDTSELSDNQVRIAVLETLSENLSDGVIAPLFYYFIGGIPLMFVYKMVNTLDSMIGYKNPRHKYFGWFSARLDDVLNFIPARMTALLIAMIGFSRRAIHFIFHYGHQHASPNAGYPEAALAGVLNCRFGGPNYYSGHLVEKPYIGKIGRNIEERDLIHTIWINIGVTLLSALLWIILIIVIL